jgi:HAD superfamily hydrolase (TIGR01509 family)
VLVDTERLYFQATRQILNTVDIPLTEAEYQQLFLVQGRGAWHLAEERGIGAREVERLRRQRNELYGGWLREKPLVIDGVREVLEALHGKYRMGVVTSSRQDHFDAIHERTGLLKYFDFILTASDYPRVKPHPDPYVKAVEQSGVRREACVAIEDSERGLAAAREAGVDCLVVPTPLTRGCAFTGARRVLASVTEIATVL